MSMMEIKVLDHGYVKLIEAWGKGEAGGAEHSEGTRTYDDFECGIIEAARQSTQGSFRGWQKDEKLLNFLYNQKPMHSGPFEFAGMVVEIQAPILVFREHHRHRTQSYAEMSARYAPLPNFNYVPTLERCFLAQNAQDKNKQAQGIDGIVLTEEACKEWLESLELMYQQVENLYQQALSIGVPKEVARVILPVGRYSRMRAHANLLNWLKFMLLRAHPLAQYEIQQFAKAIGEMIKVVFPRTYKLFEDSKG